EVLLATSLTIWAPMFSKGHSSSISLATVTPSLVTRGEPNFLSRTTLRPLGPSVALTARLSFSTPVSSDRRALSSNLSCLAAIVVVLLVLWRLLVTQCETVSLSHLRRGCRQPCGSCTPCRRTSPRCRRTCSSGQCHRPSHR